MTVIDVGRRRALQSSNSTLTITAFISEVSSASSRPRDYMDPQDFDGINPYTALIEGMCHLISFYLL
jgi:hypothetical protein